MIIRWFLLGPSDQSIQRRGGSGSGITTTREASISYGAGPPSSTETRWRGIGNEPTIAGSTGGFIGLISGIAIFLIILTFIGIYLRNRYRKRIPSRKTKSNSILNPLPSLSFSRPSTSDPYAQDINMARTMELETEMDLDPGETPRASRFNFTRPVYTRQRSSEWELPIADGSSSSSSLVEAKDSRGKGKDKQRINVDLPNQPDEAALPLRSKSPRPISPSPSRSQSQSQSYNPHSRSNSNSSLSTLSKSKPENGADRVINPFENPYDESRLSPIPRRRQGSLSSLSSVESDNPPGMDGRRYKEGAMTPNGSSGGEDSDHSVRVSRIREGTRFVERFESKESLAQ